MRTKRKDLKNEKLDHAKDTIAQIRADKIRLRELELGDAPETLLTTIREGIGKRLSNESIASSLTGRHLIWLERNYFPNR